MRDGGRVPEVFEVDKHIGRVIQEVPCTRHDSNEVTGSIASVVYLRCAQELFVSI